MIASSKLRVDPKIYHELRHCLSECPNKEEVDRCWAAHKAWGAWESEAVPLSIKQVQTAFWNWAPTSMFGIAAILMVTDRLSEHFDSEFLSGVEVVFTGLYGAAGVVSFIRAARRQNVLRPSGKFKCATVSMSTRKGQILHAILFPQGGSAPKV